MKFTCCLWALTLRCVWMRATSATAVTPAFLMMHSMNAFAILSPWLKGDWGGPCKTRIFYSMETRPHVIFMMHFWPF